MKIRATKILVYLTAIFAFFAVGVLRQNKLISNAVVTTADPVLCASAGDNEHMVGGPMGSARS